MSEKIRGLIAINIAAVIFGGAALYGKLPVSPFWMVAARAAFAAMVLGGLALAMRQKFYGVPSFATNLIRTGLLLCLHWVTFFASVQASNIALATLTFASFPLFSIALENLARRRLPALVELAAGATILLAVYLLVKGDQSNWYGALLGIASAFFFAAFGIVSQRINRQLSPLVVSFLQNLIVFLALVPLLPSSTPSPQGAFVWLCLVSLGVVTTALMHQLYFYALQRLPASTCSGFVALEPVYAVIFAALFFGEPLTLMVGVSAVMIVGASFALFWWGGAAPAP